MKLQAFGIIFALVAIPLILVLGYYIELQVDTITMQTQYDTKLLDSTYDAMSAFELNTANEDLSQVSDALRTIIEASNNVFITTLATNMGMSNASKAYIEPYIPALLYTLYDGYYIYAPTKTTTVAVDSDGNAVSTEDAGVSVNSTVSRSGETIVIYNYQVVHTTYVSETNCVECAVDPAASGHVKNADYEANKTAYYCWINNGGQYAPDPGLEATGVTIDPEYGKILYVADNAKLGLGTGKYYVTNVNYAKLTTKNILKSYMPYSARYKGGSGINAFDVNIVYTLDNFMTVEGTINGDEYYTKSGYLIPTDKLDIEINYTGNTPIAGTPKYEVLQFSQDDVEELIYNSASRVAGDFNIYNRNFNVKVKVKDEDVTIDTSSVLKTANVLKNELVVYNNYLEKVLDLYAEDQWNARYEWSYNCYPQLFEYLTGNRDGSTTVNNIDYYTTNMEEILTAMGIPTDQQAYYSAHFYDALNDYVEWGDLDNIKGFLNYLINQNQYELDILSSASYYCKAYIFTDWVTHNLNMIKENDIIAVSDESYTTKFSEGDSESRLFFDFETSDKAIFDNLSGSGQNDSESSTEIDVDSTFYSHKLKVIRNSIQYNLNLTMSAFNGEVYGNSRDYLEYSMPVISDAEWDQILSRVSITAFMQGLHCGLKTYNNYVIVSSVNNEITVTPEEMFYVEKLKFNNEVTDYHRIDCQKLYDRTEVNTEIMGFTSKEIKYDKIYDKMQNAYNYKYDHKNLACYDCVNDGNYDKIANFFKSTDGKTKNLKKAYFITLGKERNNLYKMNGFKENIGFKIVYNNKTTPVYNSTTAYPLNRLRRIELVFDTVNTALASESVLNYEIYAGAQRIDQFYSEIYELPANVTTMSTMQIKVDPSFPLGMSVTVEKQSGSIGTLNFNNLNENSTIFMEQRIPDPSNPSSYTTTLISNTDGGRHDNQILSNSLAYIRVIFK